MSRISTQESYRFPSRLAFLIAISATIAIAGAPRSATAADLGYGDSYSGGSSPYDDPRYADLYGPDDSKRYDRYRARDRHKSYDSYKSKDLYKPYNRHAKRKHKDYADSYDHGARDDYYPTPRHSRSYAQRDYWDQKQEYLPDTAAALTIGDRIVCRGRSSCAGWSAMAGMAFTTWSSSGRRPGLAQTAMTVAGIASPLTAAAGRL